MSYYTAEHSISNWGKTKLRPQNKLSVLPNNREPMALH
jgi:hypothetical protein